VALISRAALCAVATLAASACDQSKKSPVAAVSIPKLATIKGRARAESCGHGMAFPRVPAGSELNLTASDGSRRATTKLDEEEHFEFRNVPAGTYTVSIIAVENDLFHPVGDSKMTVEVPEGSADVAAELRVCVRPNEHTYQPEQYRPPSGSGSAAGQ